MEKELAALRTQIDFLQTKLQVELANGKKETKWVNEAVQDIWSDIEVIRDANRIHRINKKYKIYWLVGFTFLLFSGIGIKDLLVEWIK